MKNRLLARLCVLFGQPDSVDPAAYLMEIANQIDRFSEADLEKAGDRIIANHRGRTFPTPGEIISACIDVRSSQSREVVPEGRKHIEWSNARVDLADKLIATPMGRAAASEGWVLSLHDFIRTKGRLPEQGEIGAIKAKARGFDEAYAAVCAGRGGVCSGALRKLGDTFLEKRNKFGRVAAGG